MRQDRRGQRTPGQKPQGERTRGERTRGEKTEGRKAFGKRPPKFAPRGKHVEAPEKREELSKIAGLSAVKALFETAPERVERLYFEASLKNQTGKFCSIMAAQRKPYRVVEAAELAKIAGTTLHGGIVAAAKPREAEFFNTQMAKEWAKDGKPLLILDGVSNPHNLGAIARTAAFFGIPRLLLSDHEEQAGLSDASFRVSEGGLDQMEVYQTGNFAAALTALRDEYRLIATVPGAKKNLGSLRKGDKPYALLLGNEETGLPMATQKACHENISIPGSGSIQSLNVSVCAAICLYGLTTIDK